LSRRFRRLLVVLGLLFLALFFVSPPAYAAGSRNLWPNGAAGNRANTEWRTSTYGGPGMLTRRTLIKAFMNAGDVLLVGDEATVRRIAGTLPSNVSIVHASQVVSMDEHEPATAVREKKDSSIVVATDRPIAVLDEAGRVCGGRWLVVYRRILLRLLAPTAVTVGLLTFLQAIHDVPTAVLLYTAKSRPLSILMLEYSFSGTRERGAAVGVLITAFVMLILLGARFFGYRLSREQL